MRLFMEDKIFIEEYFFLCCIVLFIILFFFFITNFYHSNNFDDLFHFIRFTWIIINSSELLLQIYSKNVIKTFRQIY